MMDPRLYYLLISVAPLQILHKMVNECFLFLTSVGGNKKNIKIMDATEYSRNEILEGCRRNATFIREIMTHALSTPLTLSSVFYHKNNGVQQHILLHLKLNAGGKL